MNTFFIIVNTNNGDPMKEDINLLNYIYKLSKMSLISIDEIKQNIQDNKLLNTLKKQEETYFTICTKTTELLLNLKTEPEYISSITKVLNSIDNRLSTMNDSSNNNIAKLLITNNTQHIIELTQHINNYHGKSTKVLKLSNQLLRAKQRNIDSLKEFL